MIDGLIEMVEGSLLADLWPDTPRQQRIARLVVSAAAAVGVAAVTVWWPSSTGANVALAVAGGAAAWTSVFSMVDAAKEYPPVRWVSVVAALVGAGVVWSAGRVLIERLAHGG